MKNFSLRFRESFVGEERPHLSLTELRDLVHQTAREKGWWESDRPRSMGDLLALVHAEVSETLEEYRSGRGICEVYYLNESGERLPYPEKWISARDPKNPDQFLKPEGIPIELADIIIRVLDMCGYYGIDIEKALAVKESYNMTRPHRHGNKEI